MCNSGILKRAIPFLAALVIGLFVASFFVPISGPRIGFRRSEHGNRWRHGKQLRYENEKLRQENQNLKKRLAEKESQETSDIDSLVPPPPPMVNSFKRSDNPNVTMQDKAAKESRR